MLGAAVIVLPFVGLGSRVPWGDLPALLSAPPARSALSLSVSTSAVATLISLLLGVPLALLLARRWPGVRLARTIVVLPMTMPPVVAGMALLSTLGRQGLLGAALDAAGLRIPFTTAAVVIAQVFVAMPYLVVTLEAALRSRSGDKEIVAQTLGASPMRILCTITLPLLAPALARGTALVLGRSLGEFGATIAFAGSREGVTRTMPLFIYLERESNTETALALAIILIAFSLLIIGLTALPWERAWARLAQRRSRRWVARHTPAVLPSPLPDAEPPHPGRSLTLSFAHPERAVALEASFAPGRTTAFIGPNGSGKSTLCDVAAGLLRAVDGEVRLGEELLDGPHRWVAPERRPIAYLTQAPTLFGHLSVLDNVAYGPRCQGMPQVVAYERAWAELAAVDALDLATRPAAELSGGQAARVALARACATSPEVLILDEPFAALDVTAAAQMRAVLAARIQRSGLTTLLATHDLLDLTALAQDLLVLESGRVAESGPAAEILQSPRSSSAAAMTGNSLLEGRIIATGQPSGRPDDGTAASGHASGPPDGGIVVELLSGQQLTGLSAPAGTELRAGQRITLLLTPEAITLLPSASPTPAPSASPTPTPTPTPAPTIEGTP